jgi:hypothetical protein
MMNALRDPADPTIAAVLIVIIAASLMCLGIAAQFRRPR